MPGIVYVWKSGARMTVDAQSAGEEIEHLRGLSNGYLAPSRVVDAARDPQSVLHPAFEWDDGAAAERYREAQARQLIAALAVTVRPSGEPKQVRAFVSVETDKGAGYTALHAALSDRDLRAQVIARALRELREWEARYRDYMELAELFSAIDTEAVKLGAESRQ